jgi:TetR/AcrR family transcriptional repressor of nem operon
MGRASDARERLMEAVTELIWTGSYGATTIDQICERAGVKKGSFYYFFESKADLAKVAIDSSWKQYRSKFDAIFSASVPALERLRLHCESGYQEQAELKAKFGHVLGCPLCTLGSEVSTQESGLREKVQEIMDHMRSYLESTIRDAHAAGLIVAPDAAAKARMLYAYHEGLMTQARIENDVELLRDLWPKTAELLGVKASELVAV